MNWIGRQIVGVWQLFTWDKRGLNHLDQSAQAAWLSCILPAVVAPVLVTLMAGYRGDSVIPDTVYIAGYSLALLIAHFAYLLAVHYTLDFWDAKNSHWVGYVAVYNWATVIQFFILLIPIVLILGQLVSDQTGQAALLSAQLIIYPYLWFLAKEQLNIPWWGALLAVCGDIMISDIIGGLAIGLLMASGS